MAGELRTRNAALLIGLQSGEGVIATLTAANAILVEEVNSPQGIRMIESTEITGSIDTGNPVPVGAPTQWTFRARLRGSVGAPATGNRPPLDPLFQIAALAPSFQAAITAAALSAGSATTATLAGSFPGTAQALRGAPLLLSGPNHANKVPFITDYTAGRVATLTDTFTPALSASDSAAVPQCVIYAPTSALPPVATVEHFIDGKRRRLVDARATLSISLDTGGFPVVSATLTGAWGGEVDANIPANIAPSALQPPLFVQGLLPSQAFLMDRRPFGCSNFSLEVGNTLASPQDANTVNGFGAGVLTTRDMRFTVDPQNMLVATQDIVSDVSNGRLFPFVARAGTVVGNRFAITVPQGQALQAPVGDRDGISILNIDGKASGNNAGAFLTFY